MIIPLETVENRVPKSDNVTLYSYRAESKQETFFNDAVKNFVADITPVQNLFGNISEVKPNTEELFQSLGDEKFSANYIPDGAGFETLVGIFTYNNKQGTFIQAETNKLVEVGSTIHRAFIQTWRYGSIEKAIESIDYAINRERQRFERDKQNTANPKLLSNLVQGFIEEANITKNFLESQLGDVADFKLVFDIHNDGAEILRKEETYFNDEVKNFVADITPVQKSSAETVVQDSAPTQQSAENVTDATNKQNKTYFIEVYTLEDKFAENATPNFIGQHEYSTLFDAYNAVADIRKMYANSNFHRLEIVDSDDLNRIYYTLDSNDAEKIQDPALQQLIQQAKITNAIENLNANHNFSDEQKKWIGRFGKYFENQGLLLKMLVVLTESTEFSMANFLKSSMNLTDI